MAEINGRHAIMRVLPSSAPSRAQASRTSRTRLLTSASHSVITDAWLFDRSDSDPKSPL